MDYKTGSCSTRLPFSAKDFGPKYISHVVTLVEMYKANPPRLTVYCKELATSLW
jgi:hypothetical protein